ncbi:hypothetical protein [Flexivirga sp.]|uniref:hypothetical protein n=1 Tax=Flexivirga sp. TaxID=1962927 RepID=UPI003F7E19F3
MTVNTRLRDTARRQKCLQCGKDRVCEYGTCRPCQGNPLPDRESPAVLPGAWVFNPVTRIRDYVELAS